MGQHTTVTLVILAAWLGLAAVSPDGPAPCETCEPAAADLAPQAGDGEPSEDQDGRINPGIFVLALVLVSILVATIMVIRQSKPGMPEGYDDDEPEDGTSDDPDTSSR